MNITKEIDFYNLTPNERKRILKLLGFTYKNLGKTHHRTPATICLAIHNQRNKILKKKISPRINRLFKEQFLTNNQSEKTCQQNLT